jgi:hypothetical protein
MVPVRPEPAAASRTAAYRATSRTLDEASGAGGEARVRRFETGEPEACDHCGAAAFRPATRRERFAAWFAYGAGGGSAWYCSGCGSSWSGGSSYTILQAETGWRRRLRLPLQVVQALRDARTWHPVPRFYAIVGAAALAPATVAAAVTRVRWWMALAIVPAAAIVVAFLWSLASGLGRARSDVYRVLLPRRGWEREVDEELAGLRGQVGGFTLLGPTGWAGSVTVESRGWSVPRDGPRLLHELAVVADQGDPSLDPARHLPGWAPARPRVEVRVTRAPLAFPDEVAAEELVQWAFPPPPFDPSALADLDRDEAHRRIVAAHRASDRERERHVTEVSTRWRDTHLVVDGTEVPARCLSHADVGVATLDLGAEAVMVVAVGVEVDGLALERIGDPAPLLAESEARHRRLLGMAPAEASA